MSGFNALTVFKMENVKGVTSEALKKYAFKSGPAGEAKAWGWTSIEDLADTAWHRSVPEKGEFMAFALRVDTRKVPAPVLKLHLQEALLQEEEKASAEGKKVARSRKKELKELITAKLLSKAEAVPQGVDVAVDMTSGLVYVGSTSKGVLDTFQEYAKQSFGEEPVPLSYSLLGAETLDGDGDTFDATSRAMRWIYDQEQTVEVEGKTYAVHLSESASVALASIGTPLSVSSKGALDSVNAALEEGLQIVKLHVQVEEKGISVDACSFTLNSNFTFSGLKTSVVSSSENDDPDAVFLEKLYLISRCVHVMGKLLAR